MRRPLRRAAAPTFITRRSPNLQLDQRQHDRRGPAQHHQPGKRDGQLLQLTNITTNDAYLPSSKINITYNYTAGSNNGKIGSATDAISGETVSYQYDSLNRLISASGSGWTQTQAYDGFGNLTGRTGTGTAQGTTISTPTNATTNRLSGYSYDANGNLISTGYAYDPENRISSVNAGALLYFYDAQNKRIWELPCQPSLCSTGNWAPQGQTINLFGPDGKQLASYSLGDTVVNNQLTVTFGVVAVRSYFGGRLVGQQLGANIYEPVIQDRLGSVGKYYPYGEERNSPQLPNDQVKFATYTRDSATGNDYADQRYYTSTLGRFMTPDPSLTTNAVTLPQNWNPYVYVGADPINKTDPEGLCSPEDDPPCYSATGTDSFPGNVGGGGGGGSSDSNTVTGKEPKQAGQVPQPLSPHQKLQNAFNRVKNAIDSQSNSYLSSALLDCWAGMESQFDPNAQAGTHLGLYQLNSAAWADSGIGVPFNYANATDPALNAQAAVDYLNYLLANYVDPSGFKSGNITPQDIVQALTDYRWGPNSKQQNTVYANRITNCANDLAGGNWDAAMSDLGK